MPLRLIPTDVTSFKEHSVWFQTVVTIYTMSHKKWSQLSFVCNFVKY